MCIRDRYMGNKKQISKMNQKATLLFAVFTLCIVFCESKGIVGGLTEYDPEEYGQIPVVQEAMRFGIADLSREVNNFDASQWRIEKLLKISSQVVAGTIFYMDIELSLIHI
eukprot:TRINITY_DN1229_c0_g1_i9.p2 TRINITY_DN1229_c0_g1~~TRINITY_DN1229_c0_g1_i9.p2  ORF type:complete len:111 (-),score=28.10 TRINITY_DN1229_c0_g1_i9:77-409(-)